MILDSTIYDLTTKQGVDSATNDIINEMNRQFTTSQNNKILNIVNFGTASVSPFSVPFNSVAITSKPHGLGYTPTFLAFLFYSVTNSYIPLINGAAGIETSPAVAFQAPAWVTTDPININFHVLQNDLGVSDPVTFTYFIFDLSLPT